MGVVCYGLLHYLMFALHNIQTVCYRGTTTTQGNLGE
jgi:hypothetical protein